MAKTKGLGEVGAMGAVEMALEPLSPEEQGRVLRWAAERFGITLPGAAATRQDGKVVRKEHSASEPDPTDVGTFYSQAAPETQTQRALVVAYWVQEVDGKGEFDSQTVNTHLKNLGHGVSNITRAFDELKKQKPQPIIQTEKAGKSKQARKRYRVTAVGKAEVKRMLAGMSEE